MLNNVNNDSKPKKLVIVGGGTAGWMAANLLATQWKDTEIILVESQEIGIIGVGEGSTPHLKLFFDAIGVADADWMPECNATYKNGITFDKWSTIEGFESYFHPFAAQTDDIFTVPHFFNNIYARMQGYQVDAHPDDYFLESYLSKNNLGPIPDECFPFGIAYGYHFDSALLGQFLSKNAQKHGVKRIVGTVNEVLMHNDGSLNAVKLNDNTLLTADFFIDCSGFRSLLMQSTLKVNYQSFKDNLYNDSAVVMPSEISQTLPVETKSTALSNGWAWQIPLRNRFGNGYVYSSDYINSEQAEVELRQHLGLLDSDIQARHLQMKVGRVEKHWHKNCLAVGLSQGFIEPLEATAIALSFNTIAQFMQYFHEGKGTNKFEAAFNQDINARFDGIRDYVVCHYKTNQRNDTAYWRDNAANNHISETLKRILHLWQNSQNFAGDMHKYNLIGSYQPKSWACMLAGYGVFPTDNVKQSFDYSAYHQEKVALKDFIRRCGLNFKKHHELLKN
ncbi:tryptophan halogenase family protein [Thalassotalea profundi]|uniref:Tryptophan halogenase n=1 Tax=Thalassotalea profundi TaxID=2036687 RepID=A0ABQ3J3K0_9GAMM|nr:tryptophan halogenase family protein [Thalassotalea profundi]GHF01479.1 tryptophan halogenase [Thalassotalea profundi]